MLGKQPFNMFKVAIEATVQKPYNNNDGSEKLNPKRLLNITETDLTALHFQAIHIITMATWERRRDYRIKCSKSEVYERCGQEHPVFV